MPQVNAEEPRCPNARSDRSLTESGAGGATSRAFASLASPSIDGALRRASTSKSWLRETPAKSASAFSLTFRRRACARRFRASKLRIGGAAPYPRFATCFAWIIPPTKVIPSWSSRRMAFIKRGEVDLPRCDPEPRPDLRGRFQVRSQLDPAPPASSRSRCAPLARVRRVRFERDDGPDSEGVADALPLSAGSPSTISRFRVPSAPRPNPE